MKQLLLAALAIFVLTAQSVSPLGNGSQNYEAGRCSASGTTCTVTLKNSYNSAASCVAYDTTTSNTLGVNCAVSGTTLTVTTDSTMAGGACSISSTTCTATSPYSGTAVCVAQDIGSTGHYGYCNLSGTTVTVTANSTTTDAFVFQLFFAAPSPTASHTYAYFVIQ